MLQGHHYKFINSALYIGFAKYVWEEVGLEIVKKQVQLAHEKCAALFAGSMHVFVNMHAVGVLCMLHAILF